MNENMIDQVDQDSVSEDEAQCKIHEMTYSAHTRTKALFWGEASS